MSLNSSKFWNVIKSTRGHTSYLYYRSLEGGKNAQTSPLCVSLIIHCRWIPSCGPLTQAYLVDNSTEREVEPGI